MKALFESINLIGDALYISPALRKWITNNQADDLSLTILTLNDHITPLYPGMVRDMEPAIGDLSLMFEHPTTVEENEYDFRWKFDVNKAFKLSDDKHQHLAQSYADLLGVELPKTKEALKPIFIPDPRKPGYSFDEPWYIREEGLEGAILVSMYSASCTSRDKNTPGLPPNKMLPWKKWPLMLHELRKQFPVSPIRLLGAPDDKVPDELYELFFSLGISPMFGVPLNRLALIMKKAKLLVTIDNGMSHLAASQETPTFLMYPQCLAPYYILPIGNPNMVYIQMNPVTVNPDKLHQALQFSIKKLVKEK